MQVLSEFDIRLICHGASKHNLCFSVEQSQSDAVVQTIHQRLLEGYREHRALRIGDKTEVKVPGKCS